MIVDSLENSDLYEKLEPNFAEGFKFLKSFKKETPVGVYPLNDSTKAIVSEYHTKPRKETRWEAHRNVIDVQFCASGVEKTEWITRNGFSPVSEYDAIKDVEYYDNEISGAELEIGNGQFAIFFPDDLHRPCQEINGDPSKIKKITLKILI